MNFTQLAEWINYYPSTACNSIKLNRKQVFILPTRNGILFLLVIFLMLLGSINYNNNLGFVLTFLLASTALVSMLHTHYTLHGLHIKIGRASRAFVGEQAQFQLHIDNRNQAARYALAWCLGYQVNNPLLISDVAADQTATITLPVLATKRGNLELGNITISSRFPFGLFYVWGFAKLNANTVIYPAPLGDKHLPQGMSTEHNKTAALLFSGIGGDDFVGQREHKLGDSPKLVNWKAVAAGKGWHTKQFGGVESQNLHFNWQQVQHLNTESALSQLCLWVLVADGQNANYGLELPNISISPNHGEEHKEKCLTALAMYSHSSS
jgi:uncharacterized protein (DUF58 family)